MNRLRNQYLIVLKYLEWFLIITSSSPENHLDQLLPGVRVLHAIAGKREWLPLGHVHLVEKTRYNCEGQKEKNIHMADFTFGCLNQIEHHSVSNTCKLCKFIQINPKCIYLPLARLSHIVDPRVWEQT